METEQEWKSTDPKPWKPEAEGDTIQGKLVRKREKGGKFDSEAYTIENDDGLHVVFGTTVLEDRMKLLQPGDLVKIVFKGTKESDKGNDTKLFAVDFKRKPVNGNGGE